MDVADCPRRGFDGSSIRGWQSINESDMLVKPDPATAFVDPFFQAKTLVLTCSVFDPITGEGYTRDPRFVAKKALAYLAETGIADTAYFGPEAEFFIFDDVRYDQSTNAGFYMVDSVEGAWNTAARPEPRLQAAPQGGLLPGAADRHAPGPAHEMMLTLQASGIEVEASTTRSRPPASARSTCVRPLVRWPTSCCGTSTSSRTSRASTARRRRSCPSRSSATTARACTRHQSLWKDGASRCSPATATPGCREMALYYIGGLLKHARRCCAFTNPTTNSYKRLVPGYEAPVNLAYSRRNRSARDPHPDVLGQSPKAKRIEFRCPDPSCNPYLAFSAMLMAASTASRTRSSRATRSTRTSTTCRPRRQFALYYDI
jgi:glutamine synthetase